MAATYNRNQRLAPYLMLAPYVLLTCVFFLYPLAYATLLAFHQTNGPLSWNYVGTKNFSFILADPAFHKAVVNTAIYAAFSIGLQLPLSLGLAMLLNSGNDRAKSFFRLAIFAPNLVGPVFVGVLFFVMFAPQIGLFNQLMHMVFGWITHLPGGSGEGFLQYEWLGNPKLVMPALIIVSLWLYVGFNMIYFLAALQNVNRELLDAASIDGADPWARFRHIVMPEIRPVAGFVVLLSVIGSFQLFELPWVLLNNSAGPGDRGLTVVMYLYQTGFLTGDLGYASAIGWVLGLLLTGVAFVQARLARAEVP